VPRIHRLGNVRLYVYADDHAPPHFHVVGPNSNAQVRIDDLRVMNGEIARADYAEVVAWAAERREFLLRRWRELNERD
jgi:hypothetical protein